MGKPVALINTSLRATHAWASLAETLSVMSARVIPDASITIALQGRALDADGIASDSELATCGSGLRSTRWPPLCRKPWPRRCTVRVQIEQAPGVA